MNERTGLVWLALFSTAMEPIYEIQCMPCVLPSQHRRPTWFPAGWPFNKIMSWYNPADMSQIIICPRCFVQIKLRDHVARKLYRTANSFDELMRIAIELHQTGHQDLRHSNPQTT